MRERERERGEGERNRVKEATCTLDFMGFDALHGVRFCGILTIQIFSVLFGNEKMSRSSLGSS